MKQLTEVPPTSATQPGHTEQGTRRAAKSLALWQLNLVRVGYLFMGLGLVVFKWPLLLESQSWSLAEGTIEAFFVALSLLALLGVRYPVRMLPVLLFEVTWKAIWLGFVALPAWVGNDLDGATRTQANAVLFVVIVVAVIPWRYVFTQFVTAPGDPWRRS